MRGQMRGRGRGQFRGRFRGRGRWGFHQRQQYNPMLKKRCVDVRGFPSETSIPELTEYFQQFGGVEKVMLNMKKDTKEVVAVVMFEEPESVGKVEEESELKFKEHTLAITTQKTRKEDYEKRNVLISDVVAHPTQALYVKGLARATPNDELKEFFTQFGPVKGVIVRNASHYSPDCFHYVLFESADTVESILKDHKTLDYNGTEVTVDHKKTKEELLEEKDVAAKHMIVIQGFPADATEEELASVFKSAGQVEKVHLGRTGGFAFVEFSHPEAVEAALNLENLSLGDNLLMVKKKENNAKKWSYPKKLVKPPPPSVNYKTLLENVLQQNTVEEQMHALQSELEINAEDMAMREEVTNQLQELFRNYFPGSSVHMFGSSMNGFGVKGTDLDVFLDLNLDGPAPSLEGYPKKPLPFFWDIPTIVSENGVITRESLKNTSIPDRVKLINRIIRDAGEEMFSEVMYLRHIRCPLIRMLHTATQLRVDLSINNQLALTNSRLIRMYSDYDPRLKPLYYTVRQWAKFKDIAGNIQPGMGFTNYALSMMLFHYLSVCDPPLLPTVEQLASLADKKVVIDGWDCSVCTDKSRAPFLLNNQSLIELLAGFFRYFAAYDWTNKVMKTRNSQLVDRATFENEAKVLNEALSSEGEEGSGQKRKLLINQVCILDPFVTSHNITANLNKRVVQNIQHEFEQAAAKVEHDLFVKPEPASEGGSMDWGITFLFSREQVRNRNIDQLELVRRAGVNLLQIAPYNLPISMKISILPQHLLQPGPEREAFKDSWTAEIISFIRRILVDLMLVECSDATALLKQQIELHGSKAGNGHDPMDTCDDPQEVEAKRLKLETVDPSSIIVTAKCSTNYRMWQNRRQLKKDVRAHTPEADEFAQELEVTQRLLQSSKKQTDSILEFYLTFSKEQNQNFNIVRMSLFPVIGTKEFTCFFAFLSSFIARIVDKCFLMKG